MTARFDSSIRIVLVDSHRMVLCALQRILNEERPRLEVVATETSGAGAMKAAASTSPHVIVLDVALAQQEGVDMIPALVNAGSQPSHVLMMNGDRNDKSHEAAILRGASGVVHHDDTPETLVKAIGKVHEGELWLDRSTTGRLFVQLSRRVAKSVDPAATKLASLTVREQEVLSIMKTVPGADNKTLATRLNIGEHTVRNHLSRIYEKLGVPNRVELYLFAQKHCSKGGGNTIDS